MNGPQSVARMNLDAGRENVHSRMNDVLRYSATAAPPAQANAKAAADAHGHGAEAANKASHAEHGHGAEAGHKVDHAQAHGHAPEASHSPHASHGPGAHGEMPPENPNKRWAGYKKIGTVGAAAAGIPAVLATSFPSAWASVKALSIGSGAAGNVAAASAWLKTVPYAGGAYSWMTNLPLISALTPTAAVSAGITGATVLGGLGILGKAENWALRQNNVVGRYAKILFGTDRPQQPVKGIRNSIWEGVRATGRLLNPFTILQRTAGLVTEVVKDTIIPVAKSAWENKGKIAAGAAIGGLYAIGISSPVPYFLGALGAGAGWLYGLTKSKNGHSAAAHDSHNDHGGH